MRIYCGFLKIVHHDIIVVYTCFVVLSVYSIWPFSTWVVPVFLLESILYNQSPLGYVACFWNLSLDFFSVICRLQHRRSPFKIPFYLVPPIVFSLRAHAFFYLGTILRLSWNGTTVSHWRFHDNRRMNTSADVLNSKCHHFCV
jgi:hypothetical protein